MSDNFQYFKFMTDIIDSGTWAKLSSAAKSLYPVLLKFSDQTFKYVWPSTETLMRLTGFKTKKSVILAKKELMDIGLIRTTPGSGRTNSRYYFSFNYEGSKITPLSDNKVHPSGIIKDSSGGGSTTPLGDNVVNPNNINITITNNPNRKPKNESSFKDTSSYESLLEIYGAEILSYAYNIAKKKNLENNISYLREICRTRLKEINSMFGEMKKNENDHLEIPAVWSDFVKWAESHLTSTSIDMIKGLDIRVEGRMIIIEEELSQYLQQVIIKYFSEKVISKIFISFSSDKKLNGKALNGFEYFK